jgi:hypothetical protein
VICYFSTTLEYLMIIPGIVTLTRLAFDRDPEVASPDEKIYPLNATVFRLKSSATQSGSTPGSL